MFQYKKNFITIILIALSIGILFFISFKNNKNSDLPLVAIANWGPHASLEEAIKGIKKELKTQGFIEGQNIRIQVTDVGFDPALIPQMILQLKSLHPKVLVVLATPVGQFAKNSIKEIPIVFNAITDPVEAGLLEKVNKSHQNITGASDKQDLELLLDFAQQLIPNAKRIGMLYATSEANDLALVKMMENAARKKGMTVVALPINQSRDVPMQMKMFEGQVDLIYVGASGPIQPTLPAIAAEADRMKIPVFNVNEDAVKNNQVLASFGVNYENVGINTGKLVVRILKGEKLEGIEPIYPSSEDHHGFVSKKKAQELGIVIPFDLKNSEIVE